VASVDLLTCGESMIRFSVPVGDLLVDCQAVDVRIAGAESNVAAGVAHMGRSARWLSRLTDNALGRRIVNELVAHGVDCSGIVWTDQDRVGTYFLEFGATPRPTVVTYDRAHSAASKMTPQTFDLDRVAEARILHLTGITPALSEECRALIETMMTRAHEAGVHVMFDVNYRALLWSPEVCAQTLTPLFRYVDTLLIGQADAATVFGIKGSPPDILRATRERFGVRQVAITLGEAGAIGLADDTIHEAAGYPVQIVDRIGAGDAFAAGVICGLLEGDFALGLRYGVAMSALQLTLHGDLFRLSRPDVLRLMESGAAVRPLR
jgi:2-dehydro-3-deoxygluconokinase